MGSITILHLEDSSLDADLVTAYLARGGVDHHVDRVERKDEFARALEDKSYHLILADFALPDFDGLSALKIAHELAPETPFIFVSGTLGEDVAIQSLQNGATDYVVKTRLERLVPAVTRAIREKEDRRERLRSQARLKESERRFRQLADAMKQLVWTTDVSGRLVYANREFLEYLGYNSLLDAEALDMQSVHPDDIAEVCESSTRLAEGEPFQLEYRLRRSQTGEFRWHLVSFVPLINDAGQKEGWVGTAVDIEEQKHREQALIMSEKLAATGRLAASIAHEINNPLEALANLLYLLKSDEQLSPEGERYLNMAEYELSRAAQITKQTLGFYRENSGPSNFALGDLLDEVLAQYRTKLQHKHISVKVDEVVEARVLATRGEIRQVFANLIANAIDAVAQSGTITVGVQEVKSDHAPGYRVLISDDGAGIPPENMEKIWQPFFTTKRDVGTGLGLWVCREIIRKHGGNIDVASSSDHHAIRTVFSVYLPRESTRSSPESPLQQGSVA